MPEPSRRVAVDARCLNRPHLRGMGKSLYEFVRRSAESGAVEWHLLADRPDLPMHAPVGNGIHLSIFETPGYRLHSWEQVSLPLAAKRRGVDLLFAPATTLPWWQPVPTIVTLHDTIPWQCDDTEWRGVYRDRLLPSAYHHASAVVTISRCSRRDILSRWPALASRLHVVAPGVDERYMDAEPDLRPIEIAGRRIAEPFLLYLGGADARKRLTWAVEAWRRASSTRASLVVCGVEPQAHPRVRELVPVEMQDRLILAPFIDEAEMPRLYMRAAAVLYPTLYEGFGLPAVEAQAVGTPILFSDVGSLAELKGPGAVVLPVDDMTAWVRALELILRTRTTAPGADHAARAWARRYSWDAYVERMLAVYDSVRHARTLHEPVSAKAPTGQRLTW